MKQLFICILFVILSTANVCAQRDTAKCMRAVLMEDSINQTDDYYYRINKVRKVYEGEDAGNKTILEIDRYGHETSELWYARGYLQMKQLWTYDEFGRTTRLTTVFFEENGDPENSYNTIFIYKVDTITWTEQLQETRSSTTEYENGKERVTTSQHTTYTYDGKGREIKRVDSGERAWCSDGPKRYEEVIVTSYDSSGNITREQHKYAGGCSGDKYTEEHLFTYNNNQETGETVTKDGKKQESNTTTYYPSGRENRYVSYDEYGKEHFVLEYFYDYSGLVTRCKSIYDGDRSVEEYTYDYYQ